MQLKNLKIALRLEGETITGWVQTLRNPKGESVERTNVYNAVKFGSPKWLLDEIKLKVRGSKQKYSEYWKSIQGQGDATEETLSN